MARLHDNPELRYAVRPRVVAKYVGQLGLVVAGLTIVPAAVSLASGELGLAARYGIAVALLGGLGLAGSRLRRPRRIQRNEALVVAAGIFVVTSLVMTIPLSDAGVGLIDAWFESVSGVTTTGLTTTGSVEDKPATFLFARAWMQWYGGLGIVVLSLGIALHPGAIARQLALTDVESEDIAGSTRVHAQRVLLVYAGMTGACLILLLIAGASPFDALVHALAAVSTGGFSAHDDSLAGVGGLPVQAAALAFCVACALPLPMYRPLLRGRWRPATEQAQLWTLLACGLVTSGLLWWLMARQGDGPVLGELPSALVHGLSAQSTAGFSTVDVAGLDAGSKLVMIGSMAVGGGAGSTAGGFKVLRLLILLRLLQAMLARTSLPRHAVSGVRIGAHRLEPEEREAALCVVALFAIVVLVSWLPFLVAGYDPLDALFEVVSATGTVGLSTGVSAPGLPAGLKAVLVLDMLMGRVEVVALLVLLSPATWFGRRRHAP